MMQTARVGFLLGCLSVLCMGCGGSGASSVNGKLSVKGGGALTQGFVSFDNSERSCTGQVDANGNFTITNGCPPGSYKVAITGADQYPAGYDAEKDVYSDVEMVKVIHSKYASSETSGITAEVKSGKNEFEWELDPPE